MSTPERFPASRCCRAVGRLQTGIYGEDHDAKLLEVLTLHHATTAYC